MTDLVDVDPQVYYEAAAALGTAAAALGQAVDKRWSALADCAEMAGSYDEAVSWAADYDTRAAEAIDTAMLLADAARGYAILLGEMGYNHAHADWASVLGNTAPEPVRPTDPDWISMVNRPSLPSAGGPGQGLVDDGIQLAEQIGIIIPDGDTGKMANAHNEWAGMAADPAVAGFAAELSRLADAFGSVTTSEAVFIDEDLRKMAAAATSAATLMGDLATAVEDHRAGLEALRLDLRDKLVEIGKELGKEVLIGIGLSVITAGFGAAAATARGAMVIRKFAGPIKAVVTAFKSGKLTGGIKTTSNAASHKPTLHELAKLKPKKAPANKPAPVSPAAALTEADKAAINAYTGRDYQWINELLRNPHLPRDAYQQQRIDDLSSALAKLPNYEGGVTRHTNLPPEVLAQYQKGQEVTETAFTSTSAAPGGSPLHNAAKVEFQVWSETGKDVSGLSKAAYEQEVLFNKDTPFQILDRVDLPDGRVIIRLAEIVR